MNLSAPKRTTWWLAFILGAAGIAGRFTDLSLISSYAFWLVVGGFLLLVLATLLKNL